MVNREVRVVRRATGIPVPEVFRVTEGAMPACPSNGVLVRVLYVTVDPGMRGWLSAEQNYYTVPDGAVIPSEGIVIESWDPNWPVGEWAFGRLGWQQYAAVSSVDLRWRVDTHVAPAPVWIGSLGLNGLTARVGLRHLGRPRVGDTVLVTSAAGPVGSVVANLTRAAGARPVGIAGGLEKVRRCTQELGYEVAIDYKIIHELAQAVATACSTGVDVYFDNTGGAIADAVFPALNRRARIIQSGTASIASLNPTPTGPRRERDMLVKQLSWQGLVVTDYTDLFPTALEELKQLYACGSLGARTEILEGLDAALARQSLQYLGTRLHRGRRRPGGGLREPRSQSH
jgi:NADPH-dependent curcumin reductase CurA